MSPSQYQPTSQQIVIPPDVSAPLSTRSLGPDIVPAQLHLAPRPIEPVIHADRSKKKKKKKEKKGTGFPIQSCSGIKKRNGGHHPETRCRRRWKQTVPQCGLHELS